MIVYYGTEVRRHKTGQAQSPRPALLPISCVPLPGRRMAGGPAVCCVDHHVRARLATAADLRREQELTGAGTTGEPPTRRRSGVVVQSVRWSCSSVAALSFRARR